MSDRSNEKSQFFKVYKRASQSPFDDHSTMLWLANAVIEGNDKLCLSYERYVYVHRHISGKVVGISISKKILAENSEFDSRYLDGIEMYAFLLMHLEEIASFCELFNNEFESMFLLPPAHYFEVAEKIWLDRISDY